MANVKFGNILRNLRNKCGLTQQQVADLLGLKNKSTLGSWEVGKSEPDGYTFLKLCQIYKVKNIYEAFNEDGMLERVDNSDSLDTLNQQEQQLLYAYRNADSITKELVHRALGISYSETKIQQKEIS